MTRCLLFPFLLAALACSAATSTRITEIAGTWGGDNAGLIVNQTDVHVHIGCTLGDAVGPIKPDAVGRFEATATYNVDAYPVNRGITHPATFTGRIVGETMTLTVSLTDTARVLGPVTLIYGKEPQMGACPICRVPPRTTHAALALGAAAQSTSAPVIQGGSPHVSPTAPRIIFESNRTGTNQIWIIDADGTGERRLTNEPAGVGGAQWAADGNSLFYSVASHDSSVVYELWPDSARQRKIGTFPGRSPELAPGRAQVIYDVGPWTASHLVLTDINQRSARQLTDDSHTVWLGVWSPDATRIAYTASDKSGIAVWVMNADGSNPHKVTHLTAAEGRAQMPAWSPDSQQLAFQASSSTARGKSTIWIIDLRTGGEREILPHSSIFLDETPSWFSDGVSLAFQSNRSGRMQIWTVNANGTGLRQITR